MFNYSTSAETVPCTITTTAFGIIKAEMTLWEAFLAGSIGESLQYAEKTIAASGEYSSVTLLSRFTTFF
ncbi:unnamed protein product, partial [Hymenolepis diminuta]